MLKRFIATSASAFPWKSGNFDALLRLALELPATTVIKHTIKITLNDHLPQMVIMETNGRSTLQPV